MKGNKFVFTYIIIIFFTQAISAQSIIKGVVIGSNGKAVKNASVFLPQTSEGAETDSKGNFSFTTYEKGELTIVANHQKYNADTLRINIKHDKGLVDNLKFILYHNKTIHLEQTVIGSISSMAVSESRSKNMLTTLDVYTTPTGNVDLSIALRTTPGLQNIENQEGFFIRGGGNNETGVVIDGVRVKNFFYKGAPNVASRSRLEQGLFKGMVLGIGGYSSQYGDALSGIMELNTKDMPKKSSISIGLSPIFASAQAGFFGLNRKTYTETSYGYSNLYAIQPLLKKEWNFDPISDSHTFKIRNISKLSTNGELRLSLFADYSQGGTNKTSINHKWSNFKSRKKESYLLSTLNYKHNIGSNKTLTVIGGYSRNENRNHFTNFYFLNGIAIKTIDNYGQLGANFKIKQGRFSSVTGIEYNVSTLLLNKKSFTDANWSAYLNATQQIANSWLLTAGIRGEYSEFLKNGIVLPRLSLTHTITQSSTLSIDGGMYSQISNYFFPTQISQGGYYPTAREQSEQYNITYQFLPRNGRSMLRIQLFNKQYRNLSQIKKGAIKNEGKGYARGIDLFFMDPKSFKNFKYRISYSFIDSQREFLHYPVMVQPSFVANHTASIVLQKYVPKTFSQFNLAFSFNSGFPYHNPNIGHNKFMSERTPQQFKMDFSYNQLLKFGSTNGVAFISLTNIFGSDRALSYQYANKPNAEGIYERVAIKSPLHPMLNIGASINIGTNKR